MIPPLKNCFLLRKFDHICEDVFFLEEFRRKIGWWKPQNYWRCIKPVCSNLIQKPPSRGTVIRNFCSGKHRYIVLGSIWYLVNTIIIITINDDLLLRLFEQKEEKHPISLSMESVRNVFDNLSDVEVRADVSLTDFMSGITVDGYSHARIITGKFVVRFLTPSPAFYMPGFPLHGHVCTYIFKHFHLFDRSEQPSPQFK